MIKFTDFFLLSILLMFGCVSPSREKTHTDLQPLQLEQPIQAAETKAIAMGSKFSCFLDSAGHPHCWKDPQRFIHETGSSSRGAFAMDYPKKTNAELAAYKFVNLAASSGVCAVRDDNKVLCFMPHKVVTISANDVGRLGRFTKIAALSWDSFCAIDENGILSCHDLDFTTSKPKDYFVAAEEITELSVSEDGPFACWITINSLLQCELFNESSALPKNGNDAYKIAYAPSTFLIGKVFSDKKTIHLSGYDQKNEIIEFEPEDKTGRFREVVVTQDAVICGIFEETNILKCGGQHPPYAPKRRSEDLEKEVLTTIAVGERIGCGLRPDKTITCWQPQKFPTGVPTHLKAE